MNTVELNDENTYYHNLFARISLETRTSGFNSPDGLDLGKIKEWCSFTGTILSDFEKRLILDMDKVYLKAWREENAKVQKASKERAKKPKNYE